MAGNVQYRSGIIGCGGIARAHAKGYEEVARTTLVAGADPSRAQCRKFEGSFPQIKMYADHQEMLDTEKLDLVSVCTWPPLHEEGVVAAAGAGVKGIVCEKPMAVNLAQVDRMLGACDRNGVKLIVGHQRRFNKRYSQAKEALKRGEIGDLVEVRGMCRGDLLSDGTHNIDLIRYFVDDEPIQWVMGQINRRPWGRVGRETVRYGHQVEAGAIARFDFANGVRGLMETGEVSRPASYQYLIIEGTEGRIDVYGDRYREKAPSGWRILRSGEGGWEEHLVEDEPNAFAVEIEELLRWIEEGGDHLLSGQSARADTEVLMAVYESARRRGRVDLPLEVSENPLIAMVEAGEI